MKPMQRNIATFSSFGSAVADGTKFIEPDSITIQGSPDGIVWTTVPGLFNAGGEYYVNLIAGYVWQRDTHDDGSVVDLSAYTQFRTTYTVFNAGTETTYTNEALTFAPEVDSSGDAVQNYPVGASGELDSSAPRNLFAQFVYALAGKINGLLRFGANGAIALGNPPPTDSTHGTGIWIDRTGIYGLLSDGSTFILSSSRGTTDTKIYTTPGANTWTKPAGAKSVRVVLVGGGGGGASGSKGAAGGGPIGGAAGGGAGVTDYTFSADNLGATETVTVGAGGTGGAAQTTNSTSGNDGTDGGATSFGSWIKATGGKGGIGTATSGGQAGNGLTSNGGSGGDPGAGGTAGGDGNATNQYGASGGGAGGGINSSNVLSAGGTGGAQPGFYNGTLAGGTKGTVGAGQNAGNGNSAGANMPVPGTGGGGGASNKTGNAGTGGNGGNYGGGGGGGGAVQNTVGNSGKGGDGANGIAVVITQF